MTTDQDILMEMLERATNPARDNDDNLAFQMFCMIVKSNNSLVTKAHELIVKKMHSNNTTEAFKAIELLEECMTKGGLEFQKKTAKFTFLNEIIALVLDKHPGKPAPIEIKRRILDCLMLWTVSYQDKPKIQEAYDNLKKQVEFLFDSSAAKSSSSDSVNTRKERSTILGKDDELMANLLKQGGAENHKKANLLIQHRFNQEAKRTETICKFKNELKTIESTIEVLNEMLNSYSTEPPTADSREIIEELYNTCKVYSEKIKDWPNFLGESETELLEDVLSTKDLLLVIMQRYKELLENADNFSIPQRCGVSNTLNTKSNTSTTNMDLLSEILGDTLSASNQDTNPTNPNYTVRTNDTMVELNEVFGSIIDNKPQHPSVLLGNLDLLKPTNVFEGETKDKPATSDLKKAVTTDKEEKKNEAFRHLSEIDKLSEEMFKQSLKERLPSFKKENKKLALKDMAKEKFQTSLIAYQSAKVKIETNFKSNEGCNALDDFISDFKDLKGKGLPKEVEFNKTKSPLAKDLEDKSNFDGPGLTTFKPLADISVDLDEVTPLDENQRLIFDDDDIQVTLNFTADRPSENVSVLVIAVSNKSKFPVRDFQLEASVKKPCKVRLEAPTDVVIAPRKPFRPSIPINQVVLLLNPTKNPVDITCIIGYKIGDDPDPIRESIVIKDIPFV